MDRRALERGADRLVEANRFTIAVVFPMVGAILLVASARGLLPAPLAYNPFLVMVGTLVMRLPLVVAIAPLIDRRSAMAIGGLITYTYVVEFIGVSTGWPYGEFEYLIDLGPMLGGIPLGLPVFYLPLVADALLLAVLILDRTPYRRLVVPTALVAVLLMDLVLDPGAVAIGFWAYANGGAYYGVPSSNFAGWVLTGAIALAALHWSLPTDALTDRLRSCDFALDDLVSFALLWGLINLLFLNVVPVVIAAGLLLAVVRTRHIGLPTGSLGSQPSRR